MARENLLLVADSERNANMLYATGIFVPDPFIYFTRRGQAHIVMTDLEFDRARSRARHCRVLSYTRYERRLGKEQPDKKVGLAQVLEAVLHDQGLRKVTVGEEFPYGLARLLRRGGIKVRLREGPLFPERAVKTADEVKKISAALMMAEVGLSEGIHALKRAKIHRNGTLLHNGVALTSERLRAIIDTAILQAGGTAAHTIVAGGRQGCDPHERGHGRLRAHRPIIIDIFPRSQKTGYHGDITRTVVRGRASEMIRRMFAAVAEGQNAALLSLRDGVKGADVHKAVEKVFEHRHFKTGRHNGHQQGFFHGTGHGLGLEVHEPPKVNLRSHDVLRAGHVVTIEPGLYYPLHGGVRLEDVALVTRDAPRNLTRFEKMLEV